MKQGHPPFGVEMKITDDDGKRAAVGRQDLRPPEGARARGRAALLQGRRRRDPRRRRLLRHRRRRHHRPARLHADHRPLQGRDQVRRRMDFLDRPGEPRGRPSQGGRGRGDRRRASEMGRAAAAGRRAARRARRPTQGRNPRLHAGQDRQMVDARRRRLRRRNPAHRDRQDPEDGAARAASRTTCCRPRRREAAHRPITRRNRRVPASAPVD